MPISRFAPPAIGQPLIEQRATDNRQSSEPQAPDKEPPMAYTVPPLPYAYDALEPHIDKLTMEIHHDKHHQAYVDKVNAALAGTSLENASIEDVLTDLSQGPEDKRTAVKNNGGGHYNHSLFWESMSADGGGAPEGALAEAIDSAFGSFADFQAKLKEAGVNQFGSGWSWLVHDGSGLAVVGSANQDNPISHGKTPLLGVDVWEHAYYLKYQNRRPDYLDAWWNVVDWSTVAERFTAAG
jgi:superoxide dismutase, Fe-Mn family